MSYAEDSRLPFVTISFCYLICILYSYSPTKANIYTHSIYSIHIMLIFILKETFSRVLEPAILISFTLHINWGFPQHKATTSVDYTRPTGYKLPIAYSETVCQDFCKDAHSLTTENIVHNRVNENWNQWNAITAREKQINTSCVARVFKSVEQEDLWHRWWIRAASNRWPVESTVHLLAIEKWAQLPSSCQ